MVSESEVRNILFFRFRQGRYQLSMEAYLEAQKLSKYPDADLYCALGNSVLI